jgi:HemY protein
MKKWITFLFFIALIVVAVWGGMQLQQQPGYLLIAYQQWTLETPLWVGALALLIIILVTYFIFRLIATVFSFPHHWQHWRRQHRQRKASQYTVQGLCELMEGKWQTAERQLINAQKIYPQVWVNNVAAAIAAHHLAAFDRRDAYLQAARQADPHATLAIDLVQARLCIHQRQWHEANRILQALHQITPHHPETLRLLARVYEAQHQWEQLRALLPELHQHHLLPEAELERLTQLTYHGLLTHAIASRSQEQVATVWQEIPKPLRKNVQLVSCYADFLIQHQSNKAEQFLRNALKYAWHPEWVHRYGLTQGESNIKQLALAESWLKEHENDPDLLACLATLCTQQRLWGKARHYFETSLKIKPACDVYYEFGKLLEQIDEKPGALVCYRKGLEIDITRQENITF